VETQVHGESITIRHLNQSDHFDQASTLLVRFP